MKSLSLSILVLAAACASVQAKPPKTTIKEAKQPTHVEAADAWRLFAKQQEIEKTVAIRDLSRERFESSERSINVLQEELQSILRMFEKKYRIDTQKDHFDRNTFEILWSPRDKAPMTPVAPKK